MPPLTIEKYHDSGTLSERLLQNINQITENVRQHAFSLFEQRGRTDLENWFDAEKEVVWSPPSEVIEKGDAYEARLAVPGFKAKELHVVATPDALIVEAETTHSHEGKDGNVCLCEFSDKKLFRRLGFPSQVDVDTTTATLENGMLEVNAPKTNSRRHAQ